MTPVPGNLVRLQAVLSEHPGEEAVLAPDARTDVWVVEEGELVHWRLRAILERTCVVQDRRDANVRELRAHRHCWIRPDSIADWHPETSGQRGRGRATWNAAQGARGREMALAKRRAEAEAEAGDEEEATG